MTRRDRSSLLPLLLLVGLLLAPIWSGCATMGATDASSGKAKNVILLIGDGMGPSHFGAAWLYSNRVLKKDLQMVQVMNAGRTAYLVNDTADAIVTESAAAAGQIATGRKMTARAISMAADGKTPVAKAPANPIETEFAGSSVGPLPLTAYEPGKYVVQLKVTDRLAKKELVQEAPLEILP